MARFSYTFGSIEIDMYHVTRLVNRERTNFVALMNLLNVEIPAIVTFAHSPQRTRRTSPQAIILRMLDSLNRNQNCLHVKRQTYNHSPGPGVLL